MFNFERQNNPDLNQAHVSMTPEELKSHQRSVKFREKSMPSFRPNAGVGPHDDVVWGEKPVKSVRVEKRSVEEDVNNLLIIGGENKPEEDINDLLVTDESSSKEEEDSF